MSEDNKIIEINGVKFEVDSRTATIRQLSTLKVGAKVKVLKDDRVYCGVIIGFEPFATDPVVVVCYMDGGYYSSPDLKFLYYKKDSKEQIIVSTEDDDGSIERDTIVGQLDRMIATKEREIQDCTDKKNYFLKNFQVYWNKFELEKA